MYNTNFIVKYHDIKNDLLLKIQNGNCDDYNVEDIENICNKLYRDELISVFFADNLMDDKIDNGIKYISQILISNSEFEKVLIELREKYISYMSDILINSENNADNERNIDFIIFLNLFSNNIFYITHKCICQQLKENFIETQLLVELTKLAEASLSDL